MMRARWPLLLLAVAITGSYAYRTVTGVPAGLALVRGRLAVFGGSEERAIRALDRAAVGGNRVRGLQEAAESRVRLWNEQAAANGYASADRALLEQAARGYVDLLCHCPASYRPWEGLATIYYDVEEMPLAAARDRQLPAIAGDPWAGVGIHGRIAIGLLRIAIERAPTWYVARDQLAVRLGRYGLEDLALTAVRESARVMPLFWWHEYRTLPDLPPSVLDAFAEGAWQAVEEPTPLFLSRVDQLIALGSLEWRRGDLAAAERALTQALSAAGDKLNLAEAHYLLGSVLSEAGRHDDARAQLELAAAHPAFESAALSSMARLAQGLDQRDEALRILSRLRWKEPTNLDYCLEFADLARRMQDWPKAIEALKWARVISPGDRRPDLAIIEVTIEMGDLPGASEMIHKLELQGHAGPDLERLKAKIRDASQSRRQRREQGRSEL